MRSGYAEGHTRTVSVGFSISTSVVASIKDLGPKNGRTHDSLNDHVDISGNEANANLAGGALGLEHLGAQRVRLGKLGSNRARHEHKQNA